MCSQSPGFQYQVDFSKVDGTHILFGLFGEQGLAGISDASDFEKIDRISSFLGAVTDVFCGNKNKVHVTAHFTMYSGRTFLLKENCAKCSGLEKIYQNFMKKFRNLN